MNLPILTAPDAGIIQYWHRVYLDELNNATIAHQTLYEGNPAGWDPESAWGALQRICGELSMDFMRKLAPLSRLQVPTSQLYAARAAEVLLRWSIDHPLVEAGYTTKHDAEAYAKVLTNTMKVLTHLLAHPQPAKLFDDYLKRVRNV